MKKMFVFLLSSFLVAQNMAIDSNTKLLSCIGRTADHIYCIGESTGKLEEMRHAVEGACVEFSQLLTDGASTEECNESGVTPLMAAARSGFVSFVELLLKAGAKADAVDKHGFTALDYAIAYSVPLSADPFVLVPWFVTLVLCEPGRCQCVKVLMEHLHMDKVAVQARIAAVIGQLRKDLSDTDKKQVCDGLSQLLLGE